uniref:JmjC domain-containing protein n=1 Tax=Spumella elongata TaxID=89044 RepID=A0A7S3GTU2_9STRA|mmetsp:Transcript_19223/g.33241  ORF Transcript_19223/g.33241 Transcript_19223/m.33241 type:complete len:790 (+) Transcript_19223:1-2370(+)
MSLESDPVVILCKLNFQKYAESPHLSPMFKDLVGNSKCMGANRRRESLKTLMQEIADNPNDPNSRVVPPNGFVFHESRVGSTLIANFMASDPYAMVFSESTPMASAMLHCESCTHEYNVQLFRDVTTLMGRSPFHKHLFFKFQSITVTSMNIALEAFPDVPWAFVYRQPVQTMMSHLDPAKSNNQANAPCMRSKRHPPRDVQEAITQFAPGWSAPNEAWCAAHLNMLCNYAIRNFEKYGTRVDPATNQVVQRGVLIPYDSLPGFVPQILLPLFRINPLPPSWLQKITDESNFYSKSRGAKIRVFQGDSKDKDTRATEQIQLYAEKMLSPSYALLEEKARLSLQAVDPSFVKTVTSKNNVAESEFNWKMVSPLPSVAEHRAKVSAGAILRNAGLFASGASSSSGDNAVSSAPVAGGRSGMRVNKEETEQEHTHAANGGHSSLEGLGHSSVLEEKEFQSWLPFANHHHSRPIQPANCPYHPESTYPTAYSMLDITNNWNPDSTDIPPMHYDTLCHFDYANETQRESAYLYRAAEVPFVAYNIPEVDAVVKKWSDVDYMHSLLGGKKYRTETSEDNHFMYWRQARNTFLRTAEGANWKPPTSIVSTTFEEWVEFAVKNQNKSIEDRDHQYFRVSSDLGSNWLYDELPFFQPKKSLLLVEPREQKGIHCRFGMRSVIAEAHFDGTRNSVVELAGMRRWILTHPNQCENMHMLKSDHPSGRHSAVDWSKVDLEKYPNFAKVKGNEVILLPGDFLFVPTFWIHYIVSLNLNIQCNSRSGKWPGYDKDIHKCGFRS